MSLEEDVTSRRAVLEAIGEFDRLGRERFLETYGFGEAHGYVVRFEGSLYDSKALLGAAYGFEHPQRGPLRPLEFSGGEDLSVQVLRALGFEVERLGSESIRSGARVRGRNPTWVFDELILALDLYLDGGLLDDSDARVIELSQVLNRLPIHTQRPDEERFRNPNGVALKLANFAALDPAYPGAGMSRGSKRDVETWDRYHARQSELRIIAGALRAGAANGESFPTVPEDDEDEAPEGRLLYRRHRSWERNRSLANRKKAAAKAAGKLACEACGFDFESVYGLLGRDYIECHHTRPLALSGPTITRASDLALLCANCHRMAHRGYPWPSIDALHRLITERRGLVKALPGSIRPATSMVEVS